MSDKLFEAFDQCVIRSPMLSLDSLESLYNGKYAIKDLLKNDLFREAIYFASNDLYKELIKVLENRGDVSKKMGYSLLKYFIRGAMRCTPFGLFAGCSIATVSNQNTVQRCESDEFRRVVRLDMTYLNNLIERICQDKEIRKRSVYFTNTSSYQLGDKLRYISYSYKNGARCYNLSSAWVDEYLTAVLDLTKGGCHFQRLVDELATMGAERDESELYIISLIDSQIIINDLYPSVSGQDVLTRLSFKLSKGFQEFKYYAEVCRLKELIQKASDTEAGKGISELETLSGYARGVMGERITDKSLFQTDLYINQKVATVDKVVADDVLAAVKVLSRFSPVPKNIDLISFAQKYYEKFEEEEVPLLEALDAEIGIPFRRNGYVETEDLLKGLDIRNSRNQEEGGRVSIDSAQTYLIDKYFDCIANGSTSIEVKDSEIGRFDEKVSKLPNTFSCLIEILNGERSANRPNVYLKSIKGGAGASLIGRFCYLDKSIEDLAFEISNKEEVLDNGVINAEILHFPEAKPVNVIFRPVLRKYEIPFLSNVSGQCEHVIPISDIYVSVKHGKDIVLRSKKLNKRIIPRLTNAHNYLRNDSLSIYSFLCSMQNQDTYDWLTFNWNALIGARPFLPRITYKGVVLSLATWKIYPAQLRSLPDINSSGFYDKARALLDELKIPQYIYLGDTDNKLLINTWHNDSLELLFLDRKKPLHITEFLFNRKDPLVKKNGSQGYTNEIVLAFYKKISGNG